MQRDPTVSAHSTLRELSGVGHFASLLLCLDMFTGRLGTTCTRVAFTPRAVPPTFNGPVGDGGGGGVVTIVCKSGRAYFVGEGISETLVIYHGKQNLDRGIW